jgi:hypothetical protein
MADVAVVKGPRLRDAVYGIQSPMDEDTQFGVFKPLHFLMVGFALPVIKSKFFLGKKEMREE